MQWFKFKGSLAAGVLASVGASVCCVVPLVLVTLGIGGAWVASLTAFEPLRPWFIAATVVFLGLAFWRIYVRPPVCVPGTACSAPATLKRQRRVFWVVTAALLALLSAPSLGPFIL